MDNKIKKVVIAGGGTAGWMTAAALSKLMGKHLDIVLVESDEIGTVGVGEATIPTLHIFHRLLGLKEQEVMAATNATFKLGISFENWKELNQSYLHSFGFLGKDCWACGFQHFWLKGKKQGIASEIGDYCTEHVAAREGRFAILPNQDQNHAYHMDASLYAKYLRKFAEQHGMSRIEGKIADVLQHQDSKSNSNGHIKALVLESGQVINGDLFIDCTGFKALLIEQTLNTGFEDWSHWLPCDSAIAVQTEATNSPIPYTRSIAHQSGWQWRIPLQNRTGNGMVFCSKFISDDDATQQLLSNIEGEPINKPRVIKFKTGTRRLHWHKNCVAIGLSSGFLEPLESTSIHLIQRSIIRLMQLFPTQEFAQQNTDEFNAQTKFEMDNIRDFIILHYKATNRDDSRFWRYCKEMSIPDSLRHRIEMFNETGNIYKFGNELFGESSWIQVMIGQGIMPKEYHSIVDSMEDEELTSFLHQIKSAAKRKVETLPPHFDFVQHYCKSTVV
ncbi:tryptophan halogenase family protein [Shewanella woodyi]|uniref:Tryptophan halogenase n=1 Tax=Shewanella woodyi (strain ATCC 51908 / MS32) TaxID=392500 RepID=B1KHC5_SHEWM|nr:tryptophan halogenase family protein [Shewanella woodyi]ACA85433.1 tryptophan halogenase [Shewanella woodyi ATCC 51908]